jgi:hypothetical protein
MIFCFDAKGLHAPVSVVYFGGIDSNVPHKAIVIQEKRIPVHDTLYMVRIHGRN